MKKILSIIALVFFLIFVGFTLKKNKDTINENTEKALNIERYDYIPVIVHEVTHESSETTVEEIGDFQARQSLTVSATASGRLISLHVREGQYISKGAVIGQIEHSALSSQLETTKAALLQAKKDLERIRNAHSVGATTKMQIEQAQLQVENIQSSIDGLQEQIKFYTITSPMPAYVSKVLLEQGSYAMPGTPVVDLVDIGTVKMVVKVNESIVPLLKIGKSVPVRADVFPNKVFDGKISRIAVSADASKRFEVEIDLPNSGNQLKAGMYGKVLFENLAESDMVYIPRSAIAGSLNDAKVYTVSRDSTVKITPVKTGSYHGNYIEISEGLQTGDQVVVMGQINLREGAKVSIVN